MASSDAAAGSMVDIVKTRITAEFEPDFLTAEDLSDGCGSKINVVIVSKKFEGMKLLARQRAVNDALTEQMPSIHAFTMKTWTPEQFAKKQAAGKA